MYQMWHNHSFSERNKGTKDAVVVEVGGKGESWTKFEKGGEAI